MNLSISNIAWLPKDRNKIYRFLSKEKIKGIEIAPKLLLHDIKNIFELNKKETTKHLKELKNANIIQGTIEGTSICYCLNQKTIMLLEEFFGGISNKLNNKCC